MFIKYKFKMNSSTFIIFVLLLFFTQTGLLFWKYISERTSSSKQLTYLTLTSTGSSFT